VVFNPRAELRFPASGRFRSMLCVGIGLSLDCLSANTVFLFPHGMKKAHAGSAKRNSGATQPYYKPDRSRRKPAGKARNPKPEPEFRILGLLRDSGFLWCLSTLRSTRALCHCGVSALRPVRTGCAGGPATEDGDVGAWCFQFCAAFELTLVVGKSGRSRIKFCDTAVVENLRYFQLRTSAKKSVKSAPSAVKFFSSFDFRVSDFSGAWMLELGA